MVALAKKLARYPLEDVRGRPNEIFLVVADVRSGWSKTDSFALQDLKTQANGARENNISSKSISDAHSQNPGQPAVRSLKDHKNYQPDTKNAQPNNQQALQETFEQSNDLVVR